MVCTDHASIGLIDKAYVAGVWGLGGGQVEITWVSQAAR